jgi:ferredoxin
MAPPPTDTPLAGDTFVVRIEPMDWTFDATSNESLFEAARRSGIRLPTSCRNGTCRACISVLVDGSIRYRVEWPGLSSTEKEEGYLLPCVAVAQSPLVIDVPEAERIEPR